MSAEQRMTLHVNGETRTVEVPGDETLLETLRDRLDLTSVRYSCGIGVCGTCTVLVDGDAVSACLLLTTMLAGREVTTAEGPPSADARAEVTHPESPRSATSPAPVASASHAAAPADVSRVQRAFLEAGAYQCSYCIPAMALTVHAALRRDPSLTADQLCHELGGNLCRCGSYPQIHQALRALTVTDETEENPTR